jgi:cell division protein FtsL
MSGGVKLRRVAMWIAMMMVAAFLAMAYVWKQQTHARLSRELAKAGRDRDALAAEVLLLETETRGLRHYSRLEAVATTRLGMVKPGPPVMIRVGEERVAEGASESGRATPVKAASWKGFFR